MWKKFISQAIILLIVGVYSLLYVRDYTEWHFIDSVNLIFHEAGHTLFFLFPELIVVMAGSAFQIFVPLSIALYFFLRGNRFESAIILSWVGMSWLNVSVYAGDALAQALPLLGGDSVTHDWTFILSSLDLLRYTSDIAKLFYGIGVGCIVLSIILGLIAMFQDAKNNTAGINERLYG